jgi:hypothetical protein
MSEERPSCALSTNTKYIIVGVEVGVSEIFLGMQSYSFGNSGPYAKIENPRTTPQKISLSSTPNVS